MEALLIVNPSSGGEQASEYEEMAVKKLKTLFDQVTVEHTKESGDAKEFAKKAAINHIDSVFAMGGDGTVSEVVSGLAGEDSRPRFGFFPLGTVNDLARALNISLNPREAIENLSLERSRKMDVGKINDGYFMNVVAIGMIPAAINNVEVEQKTKMGKMAYILSGLREIRKNESYHFQLEIDGKPRSIESSTLIIGSSNTVGGFEQLLPEARVDDGKLHLIYIKDRNLWETVKSVPDLLKGVTESKQSLGYETFQTITISMAEDAEIETNVDGDPGDLLPITLSVLPQHIEVFCGEENQ